MSHPARRSSRLLRRVLQLGCCTLAGAMLLGVAALPGGCAAPDRGGAITTWRARGATNVVSLGNLTTTRPPSGAQVELAKFLFGAAPDAALALIKPMDLTVSGTDLLIAEGAMQQLLRWSPSTKSLDGVPLDGGVVPLAACITPSGERIIACDDGAARRFDAAGHVRATYRLPPGAAQRIGGVACVGSRVWLTNVRANCIEIFDLESGTHERTLGERGREPAQFGLPLGLCASRDEVFVVDMLNARVQVFNEAGVWQRDIGGPGDRAGFLGRPRSVVVGPDDTVFVVDAASQRVHAFTRGGRVLTTFGGRDDGDDALVLPAGIAIWRGDLTAARPAPADPQPDYYILVAEQIVRPGVRVYAWRTAPHLLASAATAPRHNPRAPAPVASPHWSADACGSCHTVDGGKVQPIAPDKVDDLCLSCHDGEKASREVHPIGRPAITVNTKIPDGWPLVNGRIGCLACHDIRRHCDTPSPRPFENAALIRGFNARDPLSSCAQCHTSQNWRVNPHHGTLAGGPTATNTCGFCHAAQPRTAPGGEPQFDPKLRAAATKLCLNCHQMHADPAPRGHLDMTLPDRMKHADPDVLPLDDGRIACSTCHNPHAADAALAAYFQRPLAQARSTAPADAKKALRLEHTTLCTHCHPK